MTILFDVTREFLGAKIRSLMGYPTVGPAYDPFCELEVRRLGEFLTFDRGCRISRTEVAVELRARELRFMRRHSLSHPPSQIRAVEELFSAWMLREKARNPEPRPTELTTGCWWQVLGLHPQERNPCTIKAAYRRLATRTHPDHGGSSAEMTRLNHAFAEAREELSFV